MSHLLRPNIFFSLLLGKPGHSGLQDLHSQPGHTFGFRENVVNKEKFLLLIEPVVLLRINVPKLQSPINIPDHSPHVLRTELVVDYYSYFLTTFNIVITTS